MIDKNKYCLIVFNNKTLKTICSSFNYSNSVTKKCYS